MTNIPLVASTSINRTFLHLIAFLAPTGGSLTAVLEPLFLKYKVDVYFAGHMHDYERVLPNINGSVVAQGNRYENPSAPVYVVVGNGRTRIALT